MAKKPLQRAERVEVFYDQRRWELLRSFRSRAVEIMEALSSFHLNSVVHGSIARGDVNPESDVDVFVWDAPSSFMVEMALERAGIPVNRRILVQATPSYAVKGYIEIDRQRSVSFPLVKLRSVERGFYRFSGEASLKMLKDDVRVPGVDKRLVLIEPTPRGHVESSVIGREEEVASLLNVPVETVLDRVHALTRRDAVGRTGLFIKRVLAPDETFEMVLKGLADKNPAIRRRLKLYEE